MQTKLWGSVWFKNEGRTGSPTGGLNAGSLYVGFNLITVGLELTAAGLSAGRGGKPAPTYLGSASVGGSLPDAGGIFSCRLHRSATVPAGAIPLLTAYAELTPRKEGRL